MYPWGHDGLTFPQGGKSACASCGEERKLSSRCKYCGAGLCRSCKGVCQSCQVEGGLEKMPSNPVRDVPEADDDDRYRPRWAW